MKSLLNARFANLGLPDNINLLFRDKLESFETAKLSDAINSGNPLNALKQENDNFLNLLYILSNMDNAFLNFKKRNIPDDIILDSLNDVRVWVLNLYNCKKEIGLTEIEWESSIQNAEVIKLGRLQFQPFKSDFESPKHGIRLGDNALNMHIQEGSGMTPEACRESIAAAREFFKKYYPDFNYTHMVCESWLLDPALITLVKPDSNIAHFYNMFDIAKIIPSSSALKRIYGPDSDKPTAELPETSSLQKNLKAYLLNGGKLSAGYGVLKN